MGFYLNKNTYITSMSSNRERSERRINISPYMGTYSDWDPFRDWSSSRDFGMPMTDYDFELARRRFFRQRDPLTSASRRMDMDTMMTRPTFSRQLSEGRSDVSMADGVFKITLDVKNFDPEDIKVKTVGDQVEDQGMVKRDFTRKYNIPTNVDPLSITSALSQDGILTVQAPIKTPQLDGPRVLEVKHEKPALK